MWHLIRSEGVTRLTVVAGWLAGEPLWVTILAPRWK